MRATNDGIVLPLQSQSSGNSTPLVDDPRLHVGGFISADAVLSRVADYLAHWYPNEEAGVGSKRKTCFLRRGKINVDLTPVIWYVPTGSGIDQYWMPAGGGNLHWKPTNPKEDQRLLSRANQAHSGELLKIIRMFKWWNARCNADRLKGIHLEALIVRSLEGKQLDGWANTLHYLFDRLQHDVTISCPDLTGLGAPLNSTLTDINRDLTAVSLQIGSISAALAKLAADAGDASTSIDRWKTILPLDS